MKFLTEIYRNEMAHRLQALGYKLRTTAHGYEIEGVSEEIIQRFSKGRRAILAESTRLEQELKHVISNNSRAAIAHHIRERKIAQPEFRRSQGVATDATFPKGIGRLGTTQGRAGGTGSETGRSHTGNREGYSNKIPPTGISETRAVLITTLKAAPVKGTRLASPEIRINTRRKRPGSASTLPATISSNGEVWSIETNCWPWP